jgi:hypothetical protein
MLRHSRHACDWYVGAYQDASSVGTSVCKYIASEATSVCGLKLLVYESLSYECMRSSATDNACLCVVLGL